MKTYAHDSGLPALPLPELAATCAALPELLAPLLDAPTLDASLAALELFSRAGGEGEILQAALRERMSALPGNTSWLRPFWDDMYTSWREPLPVNMNYCLCFDAKRWGGPLALPRLLRALAMVLSRLDAGELEPEGSRDGYLSMDQALGCLYSRIPGRSKDTLAGQRAAKSAHLAVVCAGHWFMVPLRASDGSLAQESSLSRAFAAVRKQAAALPEAPSPGVITTAPRTRAAELREALQLKLQNRLSLSLLEDALCVVCLDPARGTEQDMQRSLLCGQASSRWFDKSLQIIASEDGYLGANFEHAGCDAAIWLYLLGRADALLCDSGANGENPAKARDMQDGIAPTLLVWDIEDDLAAQLAALGNDFQALSDMLDIHCRAFPEFSRERLKALGTSPDAFLQTAFQVAQHKVFGKLRSSYESISARAFAQGRTECARGSSGEALAFALALRKNGGQGKLHDLYRQAERIHKSRMQRCQRGLGVERHMYGLHAMYLLYAKDLGLEAEPAIFGDAGWKTLKHDALSTSGLSAPFIRYFAFGPVVEDGFGVGYAPGAESTGLVISCYGKSGLSARAFTEAFADAAGRLTDLLETQKNADA